MKTNVLSKMLITLFALAAAVGCGGSSGGGGAAIHQPTAAVLKIATSGSLPAGSKIGGIDVTAQLPAGVTVNASPDSVNPSVLVPNTGVVTVSGVAAYGSTAAAVYTAPTATAAATVRIVLINAGGFSTGEFATVNCNISAGSSPKATDFSLTNFQAWEVVSAGTLTLTAGMTVEIQ